MPALQPHSETRVRLVLLFPLCYAPSTSLLSAPPPPAPPEEPTNTVSDSVCGILLIVRPRRQSFLAAAVLASHSIANQEAAPALLGASMPPAMPTAAAFAICRSTCHSACNSIHEHAPPAPQRPGRHP